jgi:flagellar FliL protein
MSKDSTSEKPPKKGKKKLLIIVAAVLMLAGGVSAYVVLGTGAGAAEAEAPEAGAVVPLEPITVLSDGHFLKVSIALQATADAAETPDGSKALDLLISEFSNRSVAELSSNQAREEAKKRLSEQVSKAYEGEVMGVYLTEFVMQ